MTEKAVKSRTKRERVGRVGQNLGNSFPECSALPLDQLIVPQKLFDELVGNHVNVGVRRLDNSHPNTFTLDHGRICASGHG